MLDNQRNIEIDSSHMRDCSVGQKNIKYGIQNKFDDNATDKSSQKQMEN